MNIARAQRNTCCQADTSHNNVYISDNPATFLRSQGKVTLKCCVLHSTPHKKFILIPNQFSNPYMFDITATIMLFKVQLNSKFNSFDLLSGIVFINVYNIYLS